MNSDVVLSVIAIVAFALIFGYLKLFFVFKWRTRIFVQNMPKTLRLSNAEFWQSLDEECSSLSLSHQRGSDDAIEIQGDEKLHLRIDQLDSTLMHSIHEKVLDEINYLFKNMSDKRANPEARTRIDRNLVPYLQSIELFRLVECDHLLNAMTEYLLLFEDTGDRVVNRIYEELLLNPAPSGPSYFVHELAITSRSLFTKISEDYLRNINRIDRVAMACTVAKSRFGNRHPKSLLATLAVKIKSELSPSEIEELTQATMMEDLDKLSK